MRSRRLILAPVTTCLALVLPACLNDSDTISGTGPDAIPDLAPQPAPAVHHSAGPSVQGLDRRNWSVVTIDAPRGQVEHQPTYAEPLVFNGGAARNGDLFPTPDSALRLGTPVDDAAAEGALEAGWPAVLLVASPARMVLGMPPWMTMRGPDQASGTLPSAQARDNGAMWMWVVAPGTPEPRNTTP